ncbi:MAG: hypothetical protein WDM80_16990 [Limisphaerales bacterium]
MPLATYHSQKGVALIITLILLSVTLIMAIAFLAISRRERASVTTSTDTVTARLAADDALAKATAQIIATIYANTNPFVSSLIVSTNYQNAFGFVPGIQDPTNVNYDYRAGGGALDANEFNQNVANLLYLPRAPVFVTTNRLTGSNEFRFYLDLNRNAQFEANGNQPVIGQTGGYLHPNGSEDNNFNNVVTNFQTGDPEWIGVLERPDVPHGPNNKFVSRYAFVAMPADGALDLNAIHNQSKRIGPAQDGFLRDQGMGSWEINLAAFLTDLNTNQWDPIVNQYFYNTNTAQPSTLGPGFDDALSLLRFRYSTNSPPTSATGDYNNLANLPSDNGSFDEYANGDAGGSLMTGTSWINDFNDSGRGFPGADNPARFFNVSSDLFDVTKGSSNFTNRLQLAGNNGISTYDHYTFYRLLAQLGTDSSPESGKMNLNYDNLTPNINGVASATNLFAWTPIGFFTNAADRMLRMYTASWFSSSPSNYLATYYGIHTNYYHDDGFGYTITNDPTGFGLTNAFLGVTNAIPSFGIGNIPVLMNSNFVYTSAIQRILQLAANMYDASTNRYYDTGPNAIPLPTLFKPLLSRVGNSVDGYSVIITNFIEYNGQDTFFGNGTGRDLTNIINTPLDLKDPIELDNNLNWPPAKYPLAYGVPIIVGAKKGLPNFNAFSLQSTFQVTRKLQLSRQSTNTPVSDYTLEQMFNCSATNQMAIEFWNSYASNYTRRTTIWVADKIQMVITNDITSPFGPLWYPLNTYLYASTASNGNWPGIGAGPTVFNSGSFLINNLSAVLLPPATYAIGLLPNGYHFNPIGTNDIGYFQSSGSFNGDLYPQPRWGLLATNNLQIVIIDDSDRSRH